MPWMVAMFGVLVVPLGVVSIVLVILQPVAVGAWCTLCLVTAVAMLLMISPAVDEVVAMGQFLGDARRERKPFWRTFWLGGTLDRYTPSDEADTPTQSRHKSTLLRIIAAMELNNVPWTLVISAGLGVWLMVSPAMFGSTGRAADADHVAGALVITWAIIAFGEIVRPVRLLNIVMGLLIVAVPWLLSGSTDAARWNDVLVGAGLVALSIPRGRVEERCGRWNRFVI